MTITFRHHIWLLPATTVPLQQVILACMAAGRGYTSLALLSLPWVHHAVLNSPFKPLGCFICDPRHQAMLGPAGLQCWAPPFVPSNLPHSYELEGDEPTALGKKLQTDFINCTWAILRNYQWFFKYQAFTHHQYVVQSYWVHSFIHLFIIKSFYILAFPRRAQGA